MFQVIMCTCPDINNAKLIAQHLIKERLAACVNIIPNVISIYRWQDAIECDKEIQLIIKTQSDKFNEVANEIKRLHRYDTPEIIAMNIQQGDNSYLNWINESLK
ncbi:MULTISPECIES: divalent-cation tolerance protein CutA [unclassified Colwellia]|jgi:periplasmic divalent cation tolerance protein|uniref:divalent-cation tolerance protein CutA n=1 Tax=unclassified Colwellia TaxID=196834 RepID=UPI0015F6A9BD|nr:MULTISPECIES: divalent-cation tolerance protein CutA [unclassified Colwellia]MBA6232765.1 divalent-cation tolerance protein CutA [Colwellia sp. MB02u-7]MBA6236147.1 divalent-cation tolerance protein CutA [Colwellia sp. MB02u-11]MBA6256600.1 divalent-cation tolerance protein CutA [Colwellia sp. MB3u-28]MBA6261315.1 divalent-cation tolerance protein CutA [Colwellia sp. MB3u-41]MBA6298453.1 divalent-cation tolerance protein CutA [Colwellia sp. MB3u-22]